MVHLIENLNVYNFILKSSLIINRTCYIDYRFKNSLKPCIFYNLIKKKLKKGYFKLFII